MIDNMSILVYTLAWRIIDIAFSRRDITTDVCELVYLILSLATLDWR